MFQELSDGVFRRHFESLRLNSDVVFVEEGVVAIDTRASHVEITPPTRVVTDTAMTDFGEKGALGAAGSSNVPRHGDTLDRADSLAQLAEIEAVAALAHRCVEGMPVREAAWLGPYPPGSARTRPGHELGPEPRPGCPSLDAGSCTARAA